MMVSSVRPSLVILLATALLASAERGPGLRLRAATPSVLRRPGARVSLLGTLPAAGGGSFSGNMPGTGQILGGRPGASTPKGIPTSVTTPARDLGPTILQQPITAPQPQPISPSSAPLYGTLEIPAGPEDDGPPTE